MRGNLPASVKPCWFADATDFFLEGVRVSFVVVVFGVVAVVVGGVPDLGVLSADTLGSKAAIDTIKRSRRMVVVFPMVVQPS